MLGSTRRATVVSEDLTPVLGGNLDANNKNITNIANLYSIAAYPISNRITVGSVGTYTTLKAAVDWFNASATANTEIVLSAGLHDVADTVTVNNGSYTLKIKGAGSQETILRAVTGLANKPMFTVKSTVDVDNVKLLGSTLATYGTNAGENAFNFDTTNALYCEITNIKIDTFYIGLYDTIGTNIFMSGFYLGNCTTAGYRINTANSSGYINADLGYTYNCAIGFDLMKANTAGYYIYDVNATNVGSQIFVKYTPNAGNYIPAGLCEVVGCSYNNIGTFASGFDFARPDGRDANLIMLYNIGQENENPHAKVNMIDNATATTITAVNTWYKANVTNTIRIIFNAAATSGTFTITVGTETTAAINYNASAATIKSSIEALSNVTTVTVTEITPAKEWTVKFDTADEGWVPQSVDISSLGTTATYYILAGTYTCKWKIESNRWTYLPNNTRDVELWINANLLCSRNSVRIDVAIAKYNSSNVLKGYYGASTVTSSAAATTNPTSCPLIVYVPGMVSGDYLELHILKPTNAGDTVTVSDLNNLIDSK